MQYQRMMNRVVPTADLTEGDESFFHKCTFLFQYEKDHTLCVGVCECMLFEYKEPSSLKANFAVRTSQG